MSFFLVMLYLADIITDLKSAILFVLFIILCFSLYVFRTYVFTERRIRIGLYDSGPLFKDLEQSHKQSKKTLTKLCVVFCLFLNAYILVPQPNTIYIIAGLKAAKDSIEAFSGSDVGKLGMEIVQRKLKKALIEEIERNEQNSEVVKK